MVAGFGLNQPIALISLSEAAKQTTREEIQGVLHDTLTEINEELDGHERISHLVLFSSGWEEDSGLFTPTLKVKRHVVDERYREHFARWANAEQPIIWV